jgi:hypothetical protein
MAVNFDRIDRNGQITGLAYGRKIKLSSLASTTWKHECVYYFSKLMPICTCKILLAKISVTEDVLALAPWAAWWCIGLIQAVALLPKVLGIIIWVRVKQCRYFPLVSAIFLLVLALFGKLSWPNLTNIKFSPHLAYIVSPSPSLFCLPSPSLLPFPFT